MFALVFDLDHLIYPSTWALGYLCGYFVARYNFKNKKE